VTSYSGTASATVAEVLRTRGEQVARQWADLPLFRDVHIEREPGVDGSAPFAAVELVATLRVVVMEIALSEGAEVIDRQRQQLLELSTPVIKLWDRVVPVPLIGTLDSTRTQVVMETLLQAIVDQDAAVAILDITGVPMVDTVVAQYLLKTAMAVRLMGADCVISGIRPQIAQAIVRLGIDLGDITTRTTPADALESALEKLGISVVGQG
jgi:rsbT co-antagonist protein RsbR